MFPSQESGRILIWLLKPPFLLPSATYLETASKVGFCTWKLILQAYAWLKKWLSLAQSWDLRAQPPHPQLGQFSWVTWFQNASSAPLSTPTIHNEETAGPDCNESFVQSPALEGLWLSSSQLEFLRALCQNSRPCSSPASQPSQTALMSTRTNTNSLGMQAACFCPLSLARPTNR